MLQKYEKLYCYYVIWVLFYKQVSTIMRWTVRFPPLGGCVNTSAVTLLGMIQKGGRNEVC